MRPTKDVSAAICAGTTVLLDERRGRYYTLHEVGTSIWLLLKRGDGATVPEIVDSLSREYDVPVTTLEADAKVFLGQLASAGLITNGR